MPGMNIETIIRLNEGKTLEYKENSDTRQNILKTIVAFSNTAGGCLIIGVRDKDKAIVGISDPLLEEESITNLINDCIEPKIVPNIEIQSYRNKHVLIVEIFPGPGKPYFLKKYGQENGVFYRVGSTNRVADLSIIEELKRSVSHQHYDETPIPELNPEAIDFRVASEFFAKKKKLTPKNLETLDLVTTYRGTKVPTVGGIVLFSHLREKYFPDCWIQAGIFQGETKSKILDTVEIHDFPLNAIELCLEFVRKYSFKSYEIKAAQREEKWSAPMIAIREAIINAFAHMDYSQRGAPIRLSIFENRIEVENPGLLPFGLTIEDLDENVSKIRNRVIVRVMDELGYVEKWGSGIQRMKDDCESLGLPAPEFKEVAARFRVTFYTTTQESPKLDDTNIAIIETLKASGGLTTTQIASMLNLSPRTIRARLNELKRFQLVVEVGTGPFDPNKKYFSSEDK